MSICLFDVELIKQSPKWNGDINMKKDPRCFARIAALNAKRERICSMTRKARTLAYCAVIIRFIATLNIQIRGAPVAAWVSDNRTCVASRNNHDIGYVKRHSRRILSVAISMPRSICRPTITCDQGRTGAVINCIKLRTSRGKGDKKQCNDHLSMDR